LDDPRGSLLLVYLAIARRYRPAWLVWENVPGVLSIDDGRAFGSVLGGLALLGYGFAYRVLDAQYFRLAQRRRRVFVVGHLGGWRRAAAVLFERESLSGHPAPRREAGQAAPTIPSRSTAGGGLGTDFDCDGGLIPIPLQYAEQLGREKRQNGMGLGEPGDPMYTLECRQPHGIAYQVAHSLRADGFDASEDGTGRGTPIVPIDLRCTSRGAKMTNNRAPGAASGGPAGTGIGKGGDPAFTVSERGQAIAFDARQSDVIQYGDKTGPLDTDGHTIAVAFAENQRAELTMNDTAGSLKVGGGKPGQGYPAIQSGMQVRRLTPRECERLQGFPDDYTLIPYNGKPAKDGPRYKALWNSMAVPVMRWIGQRIAMVNQL
jgi:DNA (cytosine-5)-methyltransferase 1